MLEEMLDVREGILADLHRDHEKVSSLLTLILDTSDNHQRNELFRAGAVSIDICAAAGLMVGGTVSGVRVAYFEGVFHRGLHSS